MDVLILLIPMSVVLALLAAVVLVMMSRQGQFEDLDTPGFSVLADDDRPVEQSASLADGTRQP